MSDPIVSIIIPCFNVEDCIEEAVESARSQTYGNKEIICVDNGSTDRTLDVLKGYERQGHIRLMEQAKKGAPAARNMGWREAEGDWIQFLDADDVIMPGKIEHQIALLKNQAEVSFVAADTMKQQEESGPRPWKVHEPLWHGLLTNRAGNTVANLFSRRALVAVSGWDESLKSSQEYDLMFRIMQWNETALIDRSAEHTLIRTRASGSISSSDKWGNQQRFLQLMARICLYLKAERPEVYSSLDKDFFEDMYQRIRLNTVHGLDDSPSIYQGIMPKGFIPSLRPYDGTWFRLVHRLFGFSVADRLDRQRSKWSDRSA